MRDVSGWSWLAPRFTADLSAPAEQAEQAAMAAQRVGPDVHETCAAFAEAAVSQLDTLLICGWSATALAVCRRDPNLSRKQVIWTGTREEIAALATELASDGHPFPALALAVTEEVSLRGQLVDALPVLWALAVLGPVVERRVWRDLNRQHLVRFNQRLDRVRHDLSNFLVRSARAPRHVPLADLRHRAAGRTAFCLAAGPGLDAGLELVRRHATHAIIICVDVVFAKLCAAGVRVDVVMNLDSHRLLASRLAGAGDSNALLAMPVEGNAQFDVPFRQVTYLPNTDLGVALTGCPDSIVHGTNVGSATLGMAHWLGCSEAVLIGHDLAFASGAYYSAHVDRTLQAQSPAAATATISVPGNAGPVMTSVQFQMGLADLASMARQLEQVRIFNYNANLGRGALIPGTSALPEGWTPAGDGPVPPLCTESDLVPWKLPGDPCQRITEALRSFSAWWQDQSDHGHDLPARWADLHRDLDRLQLERALFSPALYVHVLNAVRLRARPGSRAVDQAIVRGQAAAGDALDRWADMLRATIAGPDEAEVEIYVVQKPDAILVLLADAIAELIPEMPAGSVDEAFLRYIGRDFMIQRSLFDGWSPPLGCDLGDAAVIASVSGGLEPAGWSELLAGAVAVAPQDRLVADARRLGLLAPDSPEPGPRLEQDLACGELRRSVRAVVQLASAQPAAQPELLFQAMRHAWTSPEALRVVVAAKGGLDLFGQVLGRLDRGVLDDAASALLIDGWADVLAVCNLLEANQASMHERTCLAIARRLAAVAAWPAALEQLARIPELHPLAPIALAERLRCAEAGGDGEAFDRALAAVVWNRVLFRGLYDFLVVTRGEQAAVQQLATFAGELLPLDVIVDAAMAAHRQGSAMGAACSPILRGWLEVYRVRPRLDADEQAIDAIATVTARLAAG